MSIIIIDQQKLQDVVHDPDLRHHLTQALEYPDGDVQKLRTYLLHSGLATLIPITTPRPSMPDSEEDDE